MKSKLLAMLLILCLMLAMVACTDDPNKENNDIDSADFNNPVEDPTDPTPGGSQSGNEGGLESDIVVDTGTQFYPVRPVPPQ